LEKVGRLKCQRQGWLIVKKGQEDKRVMGKDSLSGYCPVILMNRPVRTRTQGGVGAGGENHSAT
jgi:hypothetical protein